MRKSVGGRVLPPLGPTPKDIWVFFVRRKLAALCSIFVAECLTVSAFAVEVTQPADAAHGYPGVYDINGKKLAELDASAESLHNVRLGPLPSLLWTSPNSLQL